MGRSCAKCRRWRYLCLVLFAPLVASLAAPAPAVAALAWQKTFVRGQYNVFDKGISGDYIVWSDTVGASASDPRMVWVADLDGGAASVSATGPAPSSTATASFGRMATATT
jgi:hypothetical protein